MVLKSELRKTQGDVRLWSGAMDGKLAWGVSEDDLLNWERKMDILDCVASPRIQLSSLYLKCVIENKNKQN